MTRNFAISNFSESSRVLIDFDGPQGSNHILKNRWIPQMKNLAIFGSAQLPLDSCSANSHSYNVFQRFIHSVRHHYLNAEPLVKVTGESFNRQRPQIHIDILLESIAAHLHRISSGYVNPYDSQPSQASPGLLRKARLPGVPHSSGCFRRSYQRHMLTCM